MSAPGDEYVLMHQDFVRAQAREIARDLPAHVEHEELVGFGQVGLVEAARRFDPAYGVAFATFAYRRVRGAIYDGLRKMSDVPAITKRWADIAARENELLAGAQDASESATEALQRTVDRAVLCGLFSEGFEVASDAPSVDDEAQHGEALARLRRACAGLADGEREILKLVFVDGLSTQEIAEREGKHKTTVWRAYVRVLDKLAQTLATRRATSAVE